MAPLSFLGSPAILLIASQFLSLSFDPLMPRGVLVVLSQRGRPPASSLCSLGSLVFTADLLLEAFHTCGTPLIMVYIWLCRLLVPVYLYASILIYSSLYFSHIPLTSRTLALPHFRGIPTGLLFDMS